MRTFNDYIKSYQKLKDEKSADYKKIKAALLSNFSINGFKEILFVQCFEHNISADIYVPNYAQYNQEILDDQSVLYKHQPNIIFLLIDGSSFLGDYFFDAYRLSPDLRKELIEEKFNELQGLIQILEEKTKALVVVNNFDLPSSTPLGISESKQDFGLIESIQELNHKLSATYKKNSRVFLYDLQSRVAEIGRRNIYDQRMSYLGDLKINLQSVNLITHDYCSYIKAYLGLSKKCLVLDLDNTLWGGVLGEDGIAGVHLGPTPQGRPYWDLQKYIRALFERGVILAINSKNNLNDVLEMFKHHPHMILKEEHFGSMQINWEDKVTNMYKIADDLNVGVDSFVFLDDDQFNRELIAKEMPSVSIIDFPQDASQLLDVMRNADDFSVLQVTSEDKKKGLMYAQNRQRKIFEKSVLNLDEYLRGLNMQIKVVAPTEFSIPRMSQLTMKTNQWNMTTRRYQSSEIEFMSKDPSYIIQAIEVKDKFGDNGMVGLIIVKAEGSVWMIDTCLMSCRVIGRRIEEVLIGDVVNLAKSKGAQFLVGEFIATSKNELAKDVYKNLGFNEQNGVWKYSTQKGFVLPEFIQIER